MKSANVGANEQLRATIQSCAKAWLRKGSRRCDWCGHELTEDDVDAYGEWCVELAKLAPDLRSEHRVPCRTCAGPATTEIVDGIRFSPNERPSTEPPDPWSRPRWTRDEKPRETETEPERERYP